MNNEKIKPPIETNQQAQMRSAIQDIAVGPDRGRNISAELAEQVMSSILRGEADPVQTAIFLIALRMKRESLDEFTGLFTALTRDSNAQVAEADNVICLADPFDGYLRNASMTPFIPPVLAACGHHAVMHGVESVGPKHGVTAHKVYALAGMNTTQSAKQAVEQLNQAGACYIDQSVYAPNLFALQELRHRLVKRTALTTLERLLIPIQGAKTTGLVLGYVHKAYPDIYARMAFTAGFDTVCLLKGVEGGLAPALNKPLRRFVFEGCLPQDVDSAKQLIDTPFAEIARSAALSMQNVDPAGQAEFCLDQGLKVLAGESGIARESLSLACAQILNSYEPSLSFAEAVEKVRSCLDNGAAKERFEQMLSLSPV